MAEPAERAEKRAQRGEPESRLAAIRNRLSKRASSAGEEAAETGAAAERVLSSALANSAAYSGQIGFSDKRRKSRTQEMAERAEQAGKAKSVTDHTLDLGTETGVTTEMARGSVQPDWDDNPEHLDTAVEVRASLRDSGLDPMDTDTAERASFGHALVHEMANDPDLGGRTPAQLEAEHDMVVAAMLDHGYEHHSPLDMRVGGDYFGVSIGSAFGDRDESDADPFEFDDPFGLAGGDD